MISVKSDMAAAKEFAKDLLRAIEKMETQAFYMMENYKFVESEASKKQEGGSKSAESTGKKKKPSSSFTASCNTEAGSSERRRKRNHRTDDDEGVHEQGQEDDLAGYVQKRRLGTQRRKGLREEEEEAVGSSVPNGLSQEVREGGGEEDGGQQATHASISLVEGSTTTTTTSDEGSLGSHGQDDPWDSSGICNDVHEDELIALVPNASGRESRHEKNAPTARKGAGNNSSSRADGAGMSSRSGSLNNRQGTSASAQKLASKSQGNQPQSLGGSSAMNARPNTNESNRQVVEQVLAKKQQSRQNAASTTASHHHAVNQGGHSFGFVETPALFNNPGAWSVSGRQDSVYSEEDIGQENGQVDEGGLILTDEGLPDIGLGNEDP